ncbi:MAG TPA: DUF2723 domain-containing protein [Bacteroidales bacterium]|nr:DUF2723 domain-containing protein [Bacteroidales bacterium]
MDSTWGNYRRLNNIAGWILFLISFAVYLLTLEPTVSFWDCGEFILSAFKLQVGHPPGAPLFLMIGRIATFFAFGDTSKVAVMMNGLSALCSAFAILFLYWTITHLVRRVVMVDKSLDSKKIPSIIGSGVIGALAYTFSDTFWFSAVEGELYALSSLVTGLVFWAMLKWEEEADQPNAGRWIILIAYIMGLGLGIHRLNLLVLPVLVFVYYFRKHEITLKGVFKTLIVAVILLWLMVFVLIPGVPEVAGWFELFFINTIGLPYNSGLILFLILLFGGLAYGIYYSIARNRRLLNYIFTVVLMVIVGYSSYAMIMIRSSARPPMNQNNPADIFSLSYYINMKQYGSSPKFFGNYYSAPVVGMKKVIAGYNKINGKYEAYYRPEYEYSEKFVTIFPRMYSSDPDHKEAYEYWGRVKGRKYTVGSETVVCPTFGENLRYFFSYQVGFMYLRYLMWNYAGRQNDIQGNGNRIHGNWISGIKFIDEARLGNLDSLPPDLESNPGNNKYFLLPFIMGLAGLLWQYKRNNSGFWLVAAFFIMTGLAIIFYLNQYPNQPRERDYAYAGSFYAFAIWIGMGFMFFYEQIQRLLDQKISLVMTFILLLTAGPLLMAYQNWDDHDRSGRYTARDIGANYLNSTAPNSILFTYGDNDSFPVWYVQDVEQVRTDVRVANLSYIQAGWYIEMMRQKAFDSDPMPLTLGPDKYIEGKREQLPVNNRVNKPVELSQIVQFAGMDDNKYRIDYSGRGDYMNYLPANKFLIDVDSATVLANGTVKPYYKDRMVSPMIWEYTESDAFKGDLAIMDMLSTNKWNRPVYYSTTVPSAQYKGLEKYFIQEGLAYRVVPVKSAVTEDGRGEFGMIDTEEMYNNLMNRFRWGNADDPDVYLDENNRRMFGNFRRVFASLARELLVKGDTTRALEVAHRALELVPADKLPNDFFSIGIAEVLYMAGRNNEAEDIVNEIINYSIAYLDYTMTLRAVERYGLDYATGINMQTLRDLYNLSVKLKLESLSAKIEPILSNYYSRLYSVK